MDRVIFSGRRRCLSVWDKIIYVSGILPKRIGRNPFWAKSTWKSSHLWPGRRDLESAWALCKSVTGFWNLSQGEFFSKSMNRWNECRPSILMNIIWATIAPLFIEISWKHTFCTRSARSILSLFPWNFIWHAAVVDCSSAGIVVAKSVSHRFSPMMRKPTLQFWIKWYNIRSDFCFLVKLDW